MNPNLLFPRLSIRAKLAIAFAGIAIVPVAVVATLGVRHTLRQARDFAVTTLEHDVVEARAQTQQRLREVEADLAYVASDLLGARLRAGWATGDGSEISGTAALLRLKPLHFQMKAIGPEGRLLAVVRASGRVDLEAPADEGVYYALRAQALRPREHDVFPVEVRDSEGNGIRPVLAIVECIRDGEGGYAGAVVTEVNAADVFAPLENASPNLEGVTGLVDSQGLLLFHSVRKAEWSSLLADRTALELEDELASDADGTFLDTTLTRVRALAGDRILVSTPLELLGGRSPPLVVYRILPGAVLQAEARRFVRATLIAGFGVVGVVILLATGAAHQLTQPIYRLRAAARRLASGETLEGPLEIETRDEIEDLAADFAAMDQALATRRRGLEDLVEDRTRALDETSAELAGILQHSADAIVGTDPAGRVRVWNDGARELFGYALADAMGRHIDDLILPEGDRWVRESEFIRSEMERRGVLANFQTRRRARDGHSFDASLTQTAIADEGGEIFGYSLIFRDTTAQVRLEEQMRRSERLAALSVMAGGLAHELGNPLAIIQNRIECMQAEVRARPDSEGLRADLDVLSQHANRLHGLIGDFLSFARDGREEEQAIELGPLVRRIGTLLDRTLRTRGVSLDLEIDERTPAIPGNAKAIETTIMNLLVNALDAMPEGGRVTVRTRPDPGSDAATVEISDTGHGIPNSIRHKIFEPFFTTKDGGRGTGLGLAVCRAVVERHGGTIHVTSDSGRGASFTLRFPTRRFEIPWQTVESS